MEILKGVKKVPGGLMVVPLLLGAFINTFFPQVLEIGGFTTHLFKTGAMPILAVFLFCNGAQINVKQACFHHHSHEHIFFHLPLFQDQI